MLCVFFLYKDGLTKKEETDRVRLVRETIWNGLVWNCSIIAVALLFIVFKKNKAFGNESKTIREKAERSNVYV